MYIMSISAAKGNELAHFGKVHYFANKSRAEQYLHSYLGREEIKNAITHGNLVILRPDNNIAELFVPALKERMEMKQLAAVLSQWIGYTKACHVFDQSTSIFQRSRWRKIVMNRY